MLALELNPAPKCRLKFSYAQIDWVPKASGGYSLVAFENQILYIGQAVNIRRRIEDHLGNEEKREKTPYGKIFWLSYFLCSEMELNEIENGWANQYKLKHGELPFFNKVSPPS